VVGVRGAVSVEKEKRLSLLGRLNETQFNRQQPHDRRLDANISSPEIL
jgi:hypothetical protein